MVTNTIFFLPTSYLFTPFVPNGNFWSLVIAVVPRVLIGITPYFTYKMLKNKGGLLLAGAGGIFILFSSVYNGDIQLMLAGIIGTNAIAEMVISAALTLTIVPSMLKLKK